MIFLLSVIVLFASLILGLTGFGFGLVTMSTLPNFISVSRSNVLVSSLALPVVIANLVPIRAHIRFKLLWPIIISGVVGLPFGVLVLVRLPEDTMRIALGSLILVSLAVELVGGRNRVWKHSLPAALTAGVLSGALGGAFSVSGPPVTLYLSSILEDKHELKASLLFYFLIVISLRLPLLAAGGVVTADLVSMAGILLIPLAIGLVAGLALFRRFPSALVRRITQVLLAVSAVFMIVRSL